jgi:hypothetical protein
MAQISAQTLPTNGNAVANGVSTIQSPTSVSSLYNSDGSVNYGNLLTGLGSAATSVAAPLAGASAEVTGVNNAIGTQQSTQSNVGNTLNNTQGNINSILGNVSSGVTGLLGQTGANIGGLLGQTQQNVGQTLNGTQTNINNVLAGTQTGINSTLNNTNSNIAQTLSGQTALGNQSFNALGSVLGVNGQPADYSQFYNMPGYQFAVNAGTQAINNQASAQGSLYTPNTLASVGQYVTGTADQDYNTYVNQLLSSAGLGSTANQTTANADLNTAGQSTSAALQTASLGTNAALTNAGLETNSQLQNASLGSNADLQTASLGTNAALTAAQLGTQSNLSTGEANATSQLTTGQNISQLQQNAGVYQGGGTASALNGTSQLLGSNGVLGSALGSGINSLFGSTPSTGTIGSGISSLATTPSNNLTDVSGSLASQTAANASGMPTINYGDTDTGTVTAPDVGDSLSDNSDYLSDDPTDYGF